jgi:glucokinase
MKAAIGIDIGGTKIAVTLGTERGKILCRDEFPTPLRKDVRNAVPLLVEIINRFILAAKSKKLRVLGVGIAAPGAINPSSGKIPYSPNMPGWKDFPIRRLLEKALKQPICLANDANAAACAEKIFGTAKNSSDFVYVTVSTGIGGGIFCNNRLVEGAGFSAGEVGHVCVLPEGRLCGCGRRGCLEAQSSGTAIGKIFSELAGGKYSAKQASQLAAQKNKQALQAFEIAGDDLGKGLAMIMNTVNPSLIVLGGGVLKSAPPVFLKKAIDRCRQAAWPMAFKSCKVKKSLLRGSAGDLGALALVFLNHRQ